MNDGEIAQIALGCVSALLAVTALILVLRRTVAHRIGAIFLLSAFVYHFASELLLLTANSRSGLYRARVSPEGLASWIGIVGLALLTFTLGYLGVVAFLERNGAVRRTPGEGNPASILGPSKLLWTLTTVAFLLTFVTKTETGISTSAASYWLGGLVAPVLLPLMALAVATTTGRLSSLRQVLLFFLIMALLIPIGSRGTLVIASVLVVYGLSYAGVRLSRVVVVGVAGVAIFGVVIVAGARAELGREEIATGRGLGSFAAVPAAGLTALTTSKGRAYVLEQFDYRFDGNSWPSVILSRQQDGIPPAGSATLGNTLNLLVPRFLSPSKLSSELEDRSEELYLNNYFGIWRNVDTIPTKLGSVFAMVGPFGLIGVAATLGVFMGFLDDFLLRRRTFQRLIVGLLAGSIVLYYESGVEAVFISTRSLLVFAALALLLRLSSSSGRGPRTLRSVQPHVRTPDDLSNSRTTGWP